jgi:hypothetical protein
MLAKKNTDKYRVSEPTATMYSDRNQLKYPMKGVEMTLKGKRNENLEVDSNPIQRHVADASEKHVSSHEDISRRAYEIYLERRSLPGNELDDWLQAELEQQESLALISAQEESTP